MNKQIRKMQTAAGGSFTLPRKSQKEVDEINNYNKNKAKGLFKGIMSGKVLPTMSNIGSMLGAAYNGWLDPETAVITGEAPNPGMRNPKQIIGTAQKAKSIAQRAAKISDKIFDKQYFKVLNSGNPQRVKAVRNLHFKGKSTGNQINKQLYHGTPEVFNEFKITDTADPIFHTTETKKVASKIAGNKGRVLNLFGYSKNPLRISDQGIVWHPSNIARELKVQLPRDKVRYPLESYEREQLYKLKNTKTFREEANRSFMENELKGDSYVYKNEVEGGGDSYAFPTSRQLKLSNSVTYDDSGNIIPISKRDNFLINDIRYKQGGKMNILEFLKKGGGIHIKEKNKGKFTKSAKAAGQSVQEHAKSVLNDPNATPLQKKRANFARNAAKWKHKKGGTVKAQEGTKFNWGSAIGNLASTALQQGISTYMQNKKLSSDAEADKERYKSEAVSKLQKDIQDERTKRFNILNAIKGTSDNPNAFGGEIFEKVFINQGDNEAIRNYNQSISDYNKMIDQQIRAQKVEGVGNFLSSLGQQGVGLLANSAFNKNSTNTSSASTSATSSTNTSHNLSNFWSTPSLSNYLSNQSTLYNFDKFWNMDPK